VHTVFGKITEGLDVIFQLARGDKMEKVTVSDGAAA
jgi:cyclophilin family peptidyl-prolyl cis-trans isomerase